MWNLLFGIFLKFYDYNPNDLHYLRVCVTKITLDCGLTGRSRHKTIKQATAAII